MSRRPRRKSGNSMTMSMEVKGLSEALRNLRLYDTKTNNAIEEAIKHAGIHIRDDAKIRVPVRTRRLQKSIKSHFNGRKLQGIVKADYKKAPHAHLIEFGTQPYSIHPVYAKALALPGDGFVTRTIDIPARKARPFMRPAFDMEKPKLEREITKIVREKP